MRGLQITLFILGSIILNTQSFRHIYVKWIEPTGSVLDEYRDPVEEDISLSKDLDELVALYDESHKNVQAVKDEPSYREIPEYERNHREPFLTREKIKSAIERWERQERSIFELRIYWLCGLFSIVIGIVAFRFNRWLGMVGVVTGFSEMAWWTSPLSRSWGPQTQFERLLTEKLVLSLVSAALLIALWLLAERRRRTPPTD